MKRPLRPPKKPAILATQCLVNLPRHFPCPETHRRHRRLAGRPTTPHQTGLRTNTPWFPRQRLLPASVLWNQTCDGLLQPEVMSLCPSSGIHCHQLRSLESRESLLQLLLRLKMHQEAQLQVGRRLATMQLFSREKLPAITRRTQST